ncbi:MAG: hypothetical protein OJF49_003146 [Ktedonobacterales bacterium]|nr:MAG: hypothetical protein OJF49_003146 [Ktedonobacterales bacterium]
MASNTTGPDAIGQSSGASGLMKRLFINRDFGLLWGGQAISNLGDVVFDTALLLWVGAFLAAGKSWAPLAMSAILLAAVVPQVVAGPIAGVFVDRWDKRRTMMAMDAAQAALVGLLAVAVDISHLPLMGARRLPDGLLLTLACGDVLLVSICAQFYRPARFALVGDLVPDDDLRPRAISMSQALDGLAVIFGPPIAAALVFGLGVQWALVVNALSFAASFGFAVRIRAPRAARSVAPGQHGDFAREFRAGFRYVARHRVLRTLLVAVVLAWLGFGALQVLGYFFVTENLGASPALFGWLGSCFGVGAVGGAVLVTIYGKRIGLARILWMSLVVSGIFVAVLGHLTSIGPALVAAVIFGVSATTVIIASGPLILDVTEREFVGRVTSVITPIGRLAALISIAIAGYLVSEVLAGVDISVLGVNFNAVTLVFTGMGLLAVAGGLYARANLDDAKPPDGVGAADHGG